MPPQLCFLVQGHLPASEVIWMDSRQDGRGWSCHQPSSAGAAHEPLLATSHSLWGANSIMKRLMLEKLLGRKVTMMASLLLVACHSSI